jgi:hypothetical protein
LASRRANRSEPCSEGESLKERSHLVLERLTAEALKLTRQTECGAERAHLASGGTFSPLEEIRLDLRIEVCRAAPSEVALGVDEIGPEA